MPRSEDSGDKGVVVAGLFVLSVLWILFGLMVLFTGTPDLLDAIIFWLTDGKLSA